jgi:quinol monooxygenase YgiN/quercetin dioxygenase-like cupin family protein
MLRQREWFQGNLGAPDCITSAPAAAVHTQLWRNVMSMVRTVALWLMTAAGLHGTSAAQDPLPLYPENYKLLVENDRVRVLDFKLRKDAREDSHSHPAHVVYVVKGFKVRFTFPDGRTAIRETKAGDVLFSEAVTHATENIGGAEAHGILVELKSPPGGSKLSGESARREMRDWLTAITYIKGPEGREDEIQRELLSLTAPTRAEPGSIRYDLYQSMTRKNEFLRFEVWRTPEDLELHKTTPHLKASFERRKNQAWMTEITLWKRVDP